MSEAATAKSSVDVLTEKVRRLRSGTTRRIGQDFFIGMSSFSGSGPPPGKKHRGT